MPAPKRLLAVAVAAPLFLAACTTDSADSGGKDGGSGGGSADGDLTFSVITHGSSGDAFWDVVQNGAEAAGKDLGVSVDYQSSGDPQGQGQLIDAAVNQEVDGIVVSMANPDALQDSIEAAVDAGIPVVTINSGADRSAEFGAIGHVGQDETVAGQGAGRQLATAGAKKVLCVLHEAGNIGLEQRCSGASSGLGAAVTPLQVDINDPQGAQSTIAAQLQSDPTIDAVLTLNSAIAAVAVDAVADAGSKAQVATFDLNSDVIKGIQSGDISFAVDQQQYEQGYLPIVLLKLYAQNLNTVGGGQPVLTGPGIVDADNVDEIADLATAGTR
jgi:simple sugar transport system substrate-binding protein